MQRAYNVLFLCTGNSARSIIAESLLRAMGGSRFNAFSAGSRPTGKVNPYAIDLLRSLRMPTASLESKSWERFAKPDAPSMDFVITVCDNAAGEVCPIWPGHPMTAHWGVADPAAVEGDDATKRHAFAETARVLRDRIQILTSLPVDKLDRLSLQNHLHSIGAGG